MRKALLIVLLFATIAFSQGLDNLAPKSGPDIGLKKVGIRGGVAIPFAKYSPGFGVNLIADLGEIVPTIGLELEAEYVKVEEKDPKAGISPIILTAIGGGIKGSFKPEVEWGVKPYAAAGLGINMLLRDYPRETSDEDDSEARFFEPRIELGADYQLNEDFWANFSVRAVLSNPSYSTVMIGIKYNL